MTTRLQSPADIVLTKTFDASNLDDALLMWLHVIGASEEFNGVDTTNVSRTETDEQRVWQAELANKSWVEVTLTMKDNKAVLALAHHALSGEAAVPAWEAYWKELVGKL
jgi:hypothetical protein